MFHLYFLLFDSCLIMGFHQCLGVTHRHVVGLGNTLSDVRTEFNIPLLLHPIDARHQQAMASGLHFENPIGHRVLNEFSVEALLFPGQTAGSIMLYSTNNGGLILGAIQQLAPRSTRQKPVWNV